MHDVGEVLGAWNSFYVMVGSSAAALTGLMFVVITLVRDQQRGATETGVATFSTPTVVHFCCALFTAALMTAPFRSFEPLAIVLSLTGAAGMVYVALVAIRQARLEAYRADAEDWTWHVGLPFVAYAGILGGAIALAGTPVLALFAPAAAATLLIFVGIHNAWDVVTFLALDRAADSDQTD